MQHAFEVFFVFLFFAVRECFISQTVKNRKNFIVELYFAVYETFAAEMLLLKNCFLVFVNAACI